MLGSEAQARADGNAVIPTMPDQRVHFTVRSVINNRQKWMNGDTVGDT